MKKTIIFDLDGVLARDGETAAILEGNKRDYAEFNNIAAHAAPVPEMFHMARTFWANGHKVAVYTARSHDIFYSTRAWLDAHGLEFAELVMRAPDSVLHDWKEKEIMARAALDTGEKIAFAVDNNDECLAAYERLGISTVRVHYE